MAELIEKNDLSEKNTNLNTVVSFKNIYLKESLKKGSNNSYNIKSLLKLWKMTPAEIQELINKNNLMIQKIEDKRKIIIN